ncbi:MAG: DnaD domain protein [Chloroflexi bacterium]|nr:DnaD domain protein [Chloroflexota bacterium]
MKSFSGFPARSGFTPIPNLFFTDVLPQVDDPAELKVTLHIFWALYRKKGYPRFVTFNELGSDSTLMRGLGGDGSQSEPLRRGLEQAVKRGTLLCLKVERGGDTHELYFVNTDADRRAVEKIKSGELEPGVLVKSEPCMVTREQPNIFTLYEQNIGMLTPIIAEELKEAEKLYPALWIEDAFKEAVDLNKRNWRYISRILERWKAEGRHDGEPGRHFKAESNPEEYFRRYGHILKK